MSFSKYGIEFLKSTKLPDLKYYILTSLLYQIFFVTSFSLTIYTYHFLSKFFELYNFT